MVMKEERTVSNVLTDLNSALVILDRLSYQLKTRTMDEIYTDLDCRDSFYLRVASYLETYTRYYKLMVALRIVKRDSTSYSYNRCIRNMICHDAYTSIDYSMMYEHALEMHNAHTTHLRRLSREIRPFIVEGAFMPHIQRRIPPKDINEA